MDKKYLLSDGRTKIVPLEFEQQFLNQLEKQNLTAELITDEPGKSQGTSLSQNNQLKVDEDLSIDLTTGEVISKQQQKATASKSDDGSLDLQSLESFYYANTPNSREDKPISYKIDNNNKTLYYKNRTWFLRRGFL